MEQENENFKEPWFAVVLSAVLAGLGQLYAGKKHRGWILIIFILVLCFFGFWSLYSFTIDIKISFVTILLIVTIGIWNLFDAHKCARKVNTQDFEITRKESKDPWLAVFLSFLIPGLGQLYARKYFLGIAFIICSGGLCAFVEKTNPLFFGLQAFFATLVCYQAYFSVSIRRQKSKRLIFIAITLILLGDLSNYIAFPFVKYIVQPYEVTAASMEPTILIGDRILVRKFDYSIRRVDVVVFQPSKEDEKPWIKRVIAFEGEEVEIRNGSIYINRVKLQHPSIKKVKYISKGKFAIEGKPFIVPKDSVFVLGDNSKYSLDSRQFGAVSETQIIGKVSKRIWPIRRVGYVK